MEPLLTELKADLRRYTGGSLSLYSVIWQCIFNLGFQVTLSYRIQYRVRHWPVVGRFVYRILKYITLVYSGSEISGTAHIGGGLSLPHPQGIFVGRGTVIGKNVDLYQQVTVGLAQGEDPIAPQLADGCIIYAGAKVVGPVMVGEGARVGANAVVVKNVPAGATAVGVPARILEAKPAPQPAAKSGPRAPGKKASGKEAPGK